jgi:very-short-patch-repair endonuclease
MGFVGNPMGPRWHKLYKATPAELALEDAVAALGVPYRTQFPGFLFGFRFFPDFYLPTLGLVIEVDDTSHARPAKIIEDNERTAFMTDKFGWQIVRCTNRDALDNPHGTVRALLMQVGKWPLPSNCPKVADSLPVPANAPHKDRREAKSNARRRRRGETV